MGAWGLSLFQCDWDFDLIQELNGEVGLDELEKAAGKLPDKKSSPAMDAARRRQAENEKLRENREGDDSTTKMHQMPKPEKQDPSGISYSLYAKLCSDPDKVRAHLDKGELSKAMRKLRRYIMMAPVEWLKDCYGPGYMLCLLGACAMTLGAKISKEEKDAMRKHYRNVSLMRDAVTQLENALDGYKDGVPWDFGSKGVQDTIRGDRSVGEQDLMFPGTGMINTWAPDHGRSKEEMSRLKVMVKSQMARQKPTPEQLAKIMEALSFDPYSKDKKTTTNPLASVPKTKPQEWPDEVCGGCGARKRHDGEELDCCSKCKKRLYCSRDCQKSHWKTHKLVCKVDRPNDVCGGCGAEKREDGEELNACNKCKVRRYCSSQCQKDDWKMHKLVCKVV